MLQAIRRESTVGEKQRTVPHIKASQGLRLFTFHLLHLLDAELIHGWIKDMHVTPSAPDDFLLKRNLAIAAK